MEARFPYPFTAIVGQDEMKLALILNVIDPQIGGVLILGHRGTGKSTAVRALAGLLPKLKRVQGCAYGCNPDEEQEWCDECRGRWNGRRRLPWERAGVPVVELPLGATEDRVCGSLNIERALNGAKAFEPGLLARAHRGFLYIDEVNLLPDHLVDLLLDVTASGRNVVERESISLCHPARFVLIGSGNPEEGELRPQLTDRFGLQVRVTTLMDIAARVEIVRRRERFERDPAEFQAAMEVEQARVRRGIARAARLLVGVAVEDALISRAAGLCLKLGIDGHRGELTLIRAAKALAAFEARKQVSAGDLRRVAGMCLRHRLRRDQHGEMDSGVRIQHALDQVLPEGSPENGNEPAPGGTLRKGSEDLILPALEATLPAAVQQTLDRTGKNSRSPGRGQTGSRRMETGSGGRYLRARADSKTGAVALEATLRAAAPFQALRRPVGRGLRIAAGDLRFKELERPSGILVIFVVDASGSMALNRIGEAKGAIQLMLRQAYWRRDKVALICFRGAGAEILLPPSRSIERAKAATGNLPVGGGTPLAAGIRTALEVAERARRSDARESLLVVLTDGCANVPLPGGNSAKAEGGDAVWRELRQVCEAARGSVASVVIDTRQRLLSRGQGERLAALLGGRHVFLARPGAQSVCKALAESAEAARARTE
jgi:magnesium chelatase subunit D